MKLTVRQKARGPGQGTRPDWSKCTQDGVTVLLELCVRVEQLDGVDGSRDRIAPRDSRTRR